MWPFSILCKPCNCCSPRLQTRGFSLRIATQILAFEEASYRFDHAGGVKDHAITEDVKARMFQLRGRVDVGVERVSERMAINSEMRKGFWRVRMLPSPELSAAARSTKSPVMNRKRGFAVACIAFSCSRAR